MPGDRRYHTAAWRRLRTAIIRRSRGVCEAPGCNRPGVVVDHIVSPRNGGADALDNLRHLCRRHDNEVKEAAGGERRSDGVLSRRGCDAQGNPLDPNSAWHGDGSSVITARRGREPVRGRIRSKFDRR